MRSKIVYVILFTFLVLSSCNQDQPKTLSGKIETIELCYVQWACDCARFIEPKYLEELEGDDLAAKCIFIEPSSNLVEDISDEYYNGVHFSKLLRLTGEYYLDKGIPSSYEQVTEEKPTYARVFRYSKVEYVDK